MKNIAKTGRRPGRNRTPDTEVSRRDVVVGAGALAATAAVGVTLAAGSTSVRAAVPGKVGHVTTSDGVSLYYLEAGSGPPLLMIPGWSQTAEQFKHQIAGLSDHYRVIALDMRGHGESDKPDHGYKIDRLAKDVRDVIYALDLRDVNILGHSMGCSVIWNYWDLWGPDRLSKLLLIDQMPMITSNPAWSEEEIQVAGCIFTPESLYATVNDLAGPNGVEVTHGFIGNMVTKSASEDLKAWIIARNLRMPREYAATLLYDHSTTDWRDTIPRLDRPSLVVGGRVSVVPWKSQVWINQNVAGSRLEIFEENEGGNHFMFIEDYEKFNGIVIDFIG